MPQGQEGSYPIIDLKEIIGENFREEVVVEPTFHQVFEENIAKREGVIEQPELLMRYPHFEVRDSLLA